VLVPSLNFEEQINRLLKNLHLEIFATKMTAVKGNEQLCLGWVGFADKLTRVSISSPVSSKGLRLMVELQLNLDLWWT